LNKERSRSSKVNREHSQLLIRNDEKRKRVQKGAVHLKEIPKNTQSERTGRVRPFRMHKSRDNKARNKLKHVTFSLEKRQGIRCRRHKKKGLELCLRAA